MLIFDVTTNDGGTIFLTDPQAGCWLSFQDDETAQRIRLKQRERHPLPYQWQLTEFRPLWTGQAYALRYSTDTNTGHVILLLSDGRQIMAGNSPGSTTPIEAWMQNSVGLRVPE